MDANTQSFEEVACSLEPLTQGTDAAFHEHGGPSSFEHLAELEIDPFGEPPEEILRQIRAQMDRAPSVAMTSPPRALESTPHKVLIAAHVGSDVHRASPANAGERERRAANAFTSTPRSPCTPATIARASSQPPADITPRGAEAAEVMGAMRHNPRPMRSTRMRPPAATASTATDENEAPSPRAVPKRGPDAAPPPSTRPASNVPDVIRGPRTKTKRTALATVKREGDNDAVKKSPIAVPTVPPKKRAQMTKTTKTTTPPPATKAVAAPKKPVAAPKKPVAAPKKPVAAPKKPAAPSSEKKKQYSNAVSDAELERLKTENPVKYNRIMANRKSAAAHKERMKRALEDTTKAYDDLNAKYEKAIAELTRLKEEAVRASKKQKTR
ncbi:uncharacterized protein MICPUCDRAFT_38763 [Micromonas pusilla CCMP1545]|uniref:Predicted protein n=1 Tax=Micromonas pusilla (strain CCMP1545) TaxID=564608 RepID=C1MLY1_MICPC|nr:uncharacterized protein MICPUCDRAFT_38763 [Micromonas pusilla CCMP1545]EEH58944.1 predicted protein [Micromonas pusilla CCMP1545]|eukprot:XP_003057299.1 predicted protein [Micromonas pusilla CCMP1545]